MEQGVWQEIEQLYQKFQQLGISEAVTMKSTTSILLLPILQRLRVQHLLKRKHKYFSMKA